MPKYGGNGALLSTDREIEALAENNFELDLEGFFKEEMPKVLNGYYPDGDEIRNIVVEQILDPTRIKTPVEQKVMDAANLLCKDSGIPASVFSPMVTLMLLSVSKGNIYESKALTNALLAHVAYRSSFEKAPSKIGALGGRPSHPRKEETLGLARLRWKHLPRASLNSVATYVKSQLDAKYTDSPKLPSIKAWLKSEKNKI